MFLIAFAVTSLAYPIILSFSHCTPYNGHEENLFQWMVGEVSAVVGIEMLELYT